MSQSFFTAPSLCVYELNEVSPSVLEDYILKRPNSTLAQLVHVGFYASTYCSDFGQLHPWSTWPTVHRGVTNAQHNIHYINQDISDANSNFPPIWQTLASNDITVGIFGSLQSYPPLSADNVCFHVPDTFAPSFECYPKALEAFQKFNLRMAGKNKAIQTDIDLKDFSSFLRLIIRGNLSLGFLTSAIKQVIREFFHKKWRSRRSLLQPVLGFDLYFKYLLKTQPRFSCFFTNHVAGMMHRYWSHTYPSDFTHSRQYETTQSSSFHSSSIYNALDIADRQISRLLNLCKKSNLELWVISSMGQAAYKNASNYIPETLLVDWRSLIKSLNLDPDLYDFLPAMQPDICFHCKSTSALEDLRSCIKNITDTECNLLFSEPYPPTNNTLNLSLSSTQSLVSDQLVLLEGSSFSLSNIGIKLIQRDPLTAYHIPEGIFLGCGNRSSSLVDKDRYDTSEFFSLFKSFYGISR